MILNLQSPNEKAVKQISELIAKSIEVENNPYTANLMGIERHNGIVSYKLTIYDKKDKVPNLVQINFTFDDRKDGLKKLKKMLKILPFSERTLEEQMKTVYPFTYNKRKGELNG